MTEKNLLCPSGDPREEGGKIFAVVLGSATEPEAVYLNESVPVTEGLLASTAPAKPEEVFRVASKCAKSGCSHFHPDTGKCALVDRTILHSKPSMDALSPCSIRRRCMWWNQRGVDACLRCSRVAREGFPKTDDYLIITRPSITKMDPEEETSNV